MRRSTRFLFDHRTCLFSKPPMRRSTQLKDLAEDYDVSKPPMRRSTQDMQQKSNYNNTLSNFMGSLPLNLRPIVTI